MCKHAHDYFQLVLPLNGHIDIALENFNGYVGVGEGICIAPGYEHSFTADEQAKFIVADLHRVPSNIADATQPIFQTSTPMQAFLSYVEVQLSHHICESENNAMLSLFVALLARLECGVANDKRITPVLSLIHQDVAYPHKIDALAKVACMGATQFKKRFIASTGVGLRDYLIKVRMEKARALLSNTDMPIIAVAAHVGYEDVSAFTRRFKQHEGMPPTHFKRR